MKRLSVLSLFCILLWSGLSPLSVHAAPEHISARHAILYEPITNTVLYEKNASARAPMASTTKIMTALVVLDAGDIDRVVTIADADCGAEGSSIYMVPGEKLSIHELLYALLLQSANDAAVALANHVGGSIEDFAALMNARATGLGLTDTHFVNPHGLDDASHYTTASDLAHITAAAMENPIFREIVSTPKHSIPGRDGGTRVLINHNKLLHLYDGAIGVKTGFTKKSGRCLVAAAEKNGLTLISVTLDAPSDWDDHHRLFELGFSQLENRLLCEAGQFIYELPVIGQDNRYARCTTPESVYAVLPTNAPVPEIVLDLPHFFLGCEKNGNVVGNIKFIYQNNIIAQCPLIYIDSR